MTELLRRNRVLLSASTLLLISLLLLSVSVRSPAHRDPLAAFVLDGLAPLQGAVSWVQYRARDVWETYVAVVGTRRENVRLQARVAELESRLIRLRELEQSNARLAELLHFRAPAGSRVLGARVVGRDPLLWFRSLSVDLGDGDGVRMGMAVLAPRGVVGRVTRVGDRASRVMLLTDPDSGIDAIVQRSRARGIVQGARERGCRMSYLRRDVDVAVGDRVVTSGLDGVFPKGVLLGEVIETSLEHRGLLQSALVQPSVVLDGLEEVLIVDPALSADLP